MSKLSRKVKYVNYVTFLTLILLLGASACGQPQSMASQERQRPSATFLPPSTFTDTDLLGTWNILFGSNDLETLLIRNDNTFTQTFTSADKSPIIYTGKGNWSIERDSSGCIYMHLEGMRYYYNTISTAENGNRLAPDGMPHPFIDPCLDRTITMVDKVTMIVIEEPGAIRNIALLFPRAGIDSTDIALHLTTDDEEK